MTELTCANIVLCGQEKTALRIQLETEGGFIYGVFAATKPIHHEAGGAKPEIGEPVTKTDPRFQFGTDGGWGGLWLTKAG